MLESPLGAVATVTNVLSTTGSMFLTRISEEPTQEPHTHPVKTTPNVSHKETMN